MLFVHRGPSNIYKMVRILDRKKQVYKDMIVHYRDQGQGLVEYALIMLLVAIVVIIVLALFGPYVGGLYSNIIQSI